MYIPHLVSRASRIFPRMCIKIRLAHETIQYYAVRTIVDGNRSLDSDSEVATDTQQGTGACKSDIHRRGQREVVGGRGE